VETADEIAAAVREGWLRSRFLVVGRRTNVDCACARPWPRHIDIDGLTFVAAPPDDMTGCERACQEAPLIVVNLGVIADSQSYSACWM
jgi:hypothetical protein